MLKRAYLAKLIGLAGALMLPMLASAAGDLCYLRDAVGAERHHGLLALRTGAGLCHQ